jgi:hypothetical protein
VTIIRRIDGHSSKYLGANGPEIDSLTMLSGYPSGSPVPAFPYGGVRKGYVIAKQDFSAVMGSWGTAFAANITPDGSGIGSWTEDHFRKAMKHGRYKGLDGARTLVPPMPWRNFNNMKEGPESDFHYLKPIQPIRNMMPPSRPIDKTAE